MEKKQSEGSKNQYSAACSILYMDDRNQDFSNLAPNSIISSCFTSYDGELNPKVLGLKYVAEGHEKYLLNGKRYQVGGGKYLLVNEAAKKMEVNIKNTTTWSLCVNIEPQFLNDLLWQLHQPDKLDDFKLVAQHLQTPELFVRETSASPHFRQFLNQLLQEVTHQEETAPAIERIFELTNRLVEENLPVIRSYSRLKTARLSTRQELFQRLLQGKEMLNDSIFSEVTISQVAAKSCLSEFQFYRLFRQCFGVSPYNYLFRKRINKSLELRKQNLSWNEIAHRLNFTDLAAFSKGFKKVTGFSPTKYATGLPLPSEN